MIIIPDNIGVKQVEIPCNLAKNGPSYEISFRHTTNKKTYTFRVVDQDPDNHTFYKFEIDFTNMPKGEYEYFIYTESGLLRISNELEVKDYKKKINYISYDANK